MSPPDDKNLDNLDEGIYSIKDMESLLTVNEVAHYLKLKPSTITKKARNGEIPFFKFNNHNWRIKIGDFIVWLKKKSSHE